MKGSILPKFARKIPIAELVFKWIEKPSAFVDKPTISPLKSMSFVRVVSPVMYASFSKEFWSSMTVKTPLAQ